MTPGLVVAALSATPALAAPHSGVARERTGPELSDIMLFVVAALAIWVVRRALRARFARKRRDAEPD